MKIPLFLSLLIALLFDPSISLAAQTATSSRQMSYTHKTIALTFDDGPYGTSTEQVLSILRKEHIHATFFLIGKNVQEFPAETREIVAEGNKIGNHTYSHPDLSTMTSTQALTDIAQAQSVIASTTGIYPTLFRPPYGKLPNALKKKLKKEGYKILLWNDDPNDWNAASSTSSLIISRVLQQKKLHTVLILHDGRDTKINYPRENMLEALPVIIEDMEKQDYTFETL